MTNLLSSLGLLVMVFPFYKLRRYGPRLKRLVYRFLVCPWYAGKEVTCPICGGSFRHFLRYGFVSRKNALCPQCGSLERHRLLWLYLEHSTDLLTANLRVLHFAPEYMLQQKFRAMKNLHYISADLSSPLAALRIDITDILFPDNTFDVILCSHVLEHVPEEQRALNEMLRVLKPGGWAILQAPIDPKCGTTIADPGVSSASERKRVFGHPEHVRLYGRDYPERLRRAGFLVRVDGYAKGLDRCLTERYGLQPDEDIYFCTKPTLR